MVYNGLWFNFKPAGDEETLKCPQCSSHKYFVDMLFPAEEQSHQTGNVCVIRFAGQFKCKASRPADERVQTSLPRC